MHIILVFRLKKHSRTNMALHHFVELCMLISSLIRALVNEILLEMVFVA